MDEVKFGANRRLDLVDMTRLLGDIQEAFQDNFSNVLGELQSTIAYTYKPLILTNFDMTGVGLAYIRCDTAITETVPIAGNRSAAIWDPQGRRLVGPNSSSQQDYYPPAAPALTTRYLIARRVKTDTTNEARQHYSTALGKYTDNVDTEAVDDWEISESQVEGTLANVRAYTDATLSAAGWVDIGVFQMNAGLVTALTPSTPTLGDLSVTPTFLSYSVPPTADLAPFNYGTALQAIIEQLQYMRRGYNRHWTDEADNEATFEAEGGFRFGSGDTVGSGLSDTYIRALGTALDTITATERTTADADDLRFHRARGYSAGGATGGPDTTSREGFLYTDSVTVDSASDLVDVNKYWIVHPADYLTHSTTAGKDSPWNYTPTNNLWYVPVNQSTLRWNITINQGGVTAWQHYGLVIPLSCLPYGCLFSNITTWVGTAGLGANCKIGIGVYRQDLSTGGWSTALGGGSGTLINNGGSVTTYASGTTSISTDISSSYYIVDTNNYYYIAVVGFETTAAVAADTAIVYGSKVTTKIREASHVY